MTDDQNMPVDPAQDARWTAPKLIVMGAITLALALAAIYASASIMGEQPNRFNELEHG